MVVGAAGSVVVAGHCLIITILGLVSSLTPTPYLMTTYTAILSHLRVLGPPVVFKWVLRHQWVMAWGVLTHFFPRLLRSCDVTF